MKPNPILVFDFDGVIVDGILEYWNSARKACLELVETRKDLNDLPLEVPIEFKQLRPWVKNGWEMVLLAAEMRRKNSPLVLNGPIDFAAEYAQNCHKALKAWDWNPKQLQITLDKVRNDAIKINKEKWLASHVAFPGVQQRISQLANEKIDFAVLTTKSARFTSELLSHFNLYPKLLYGHESGKKPNLLLKISQTWSIQGFIEDRRATLETVLQTSEISSIPCYLASWGYLKPNDVKNLPSKIHLLKPETLMSPLASWP